MVFPEEVCPSLGRTLSLVFLTVFISFFFFSLSLSLTLSLSLSLPPLSLWNLNSTELGSEAAGNEEADGLRQIVLGVPSIGEEAKGLVRKMFVKGLSQSFLIRFAS